MDFIENEKKILKFWQDKKIFDKLRAKNKGDDLEAMASNLMAQKRSTNGR